MAKMINPDRDGPKNRVSPEMVAAERARRAVEDTTYEASQQVLRMAQPIEDAQLPPGEVSVPIADAVSQQVLRQELAEALPGGAEDPALDPDHQIYETFGLNGPPQPAAVEKQIDELVTAIHSSTSGFIIPQPSVPMPAHPVDEPPPPPSAAERLETERRREAAQRERVDRAARTVLEECRDEVQDVFRGKTSAGNCSYMELLRAVIELACDEREIMERAERAMRLNIGVGKEKLCKQCAGEFRSETVGRTYCCNSCGARAQGMRPIAEHSPDCCLVGVERPVSMVAA